MGRPLQNHVRVTSTGPDRRCYNGHPVGALDFFCGTCGAQIEPDSAASSHDFEATGLTVARGGRTILADVSLVIPPKSLVAVVGPSGAGKTTLLHALTGSTPADTGTVTYAGHDLYQEYEDLRRLVGVVPQQDLLHSSLTVAAALDYGARLRFPKEVPAGQRAKRIENVLRLLSLDERRDVRVDRLSGGQRKRTSLALELLTAPSLLFLDEPTSGLDPGLDARVMRLARDLAKDEMAERTVIVVTHSVANVDLCDYLLVMAPGGRLAYFGPPAGALEEFGATGYPALFEMLDGQAPVVDRLITRTRRVQQHELGRRQGRSATPLERAAQPSALRQWGVLVQRQVAVMASDRKVAAMLLGLPLVLGVLGAAIGTADGLGAGPGGANPYAQSVLLVLLISVILLGIANTIQQIAAETAIYQRERAMGLNRGSYLGAKVAVLVVITLLQTAVVLALTLMGRPGPTDPPVLGPYGSILVPLLALGTACVAIGLAMSAWLQVPDRTMNALVAAVIVLIVFSGAFVLRFDSVALDVVQRASPSSWTYDALAVATDLQSLAPAPDPKAQWAPTAANWVTGVVGTSVFLVLGSVATWFFLGRMDPGRRRSG